jgi:hypothetical protein
MEKEDKICSQFIAMKEVNEGIKKPEKFSGFLFT